MTPREAGLVEFEEPDWRERFAAYFHSVPPYKSTQVHASLAVLRNLLEEQAFERTLADWRRFHATVTDGFRADGSSMRMPASAVDGVIALTALGIMPPRSIAHDVPHGGPCFQEQHDRHCEFQTGGEMWRIIGIQDRMLMLKRGWEGDWEEKQIDLSRAKWDTYIERASAALSSNSSPSILLPESA